MIILSAKLIELVEAFIPVISLLENEEHNGFFPLQLNKSHYDNVNI